MRDGVSARVRMLGIGLANLASLVSLVGLASSAWAQSGDGGGAPAAGALWERLQEPLSPWATAVFVWLVLFVVMAFMVGVAWLTRPRRH